MKESAHRSNAFGLCKVWNRIGGDWIVTKHSQHINTTASFSRFLGGKVARRKASTPHHTLETRFNLRAVTVKQA
jgi:hypothetical protein